MDTESLHEPLVVICIPTYNAADTLRETLDSLLIQSYRNIEIHILDNCSEDTTLDLLAEIDDPRLYIHSHDINVGAEGNFSRCIKMAGGFYTCIYHADDVYDPLIVEKQVSYLEATPQVEAVFAQASTIDDESTVTGHIDLIPPVPAGIVKEYCFLALLKNLLRNGNRLVISSLMVRTSVFQQHIRDWGDGRFKSASDLDMYLRLAQRAPIAIIGERLIQYRISEKQFSQRIRDRVERPDFFLVTEVYIAQHSQDLDADDIRRYRWIERHDVVARAMNATISGDTAKARLLLKDTLSFDALHGALSSKRGLATLAASSYLHLVSAIGLWKHSLVLTRWAKARKWV